MLIDDEARLQNLFAQYQSGQLSVPGQKKRVSALAVEDAIKQREKVTDAKERFDRIRANLDAILNGINIDSKWNRFRTRLGLYICSDATTYRLERINSEAQRYL